MNKLAMFMLANSGGGGGSRKSAEYINIKCSTLNGSSGFGFDADYIVSDFDRLYFVTDFSANYTFNGSETKEYRGYKLWKLNSDFSNIRGELDGTYCTIDSDNNYSESKKATIKFYDGYVYVYVDENITGEAVFNGKGILKEYIG